MAGTEALPANLADLPQRGAFVRRMFGRIALRYDAMNRLMTGGMDWGWRRALLEEAALPRGGSLIDLATGTGDVAWLALERDPSARAVGADFSIDMIRAGRDLPGRRAIHWQQSDALRLPFADHCFDAATSAFLIRNLPPKHVRDAFAEQARVIKPGGRVACLEITPPPKGILAPTINLYMRRIIPVLGGLVARDRAAYRYLAISAAQFKPPEEIAAIMREAGLIRVRFRRLALGTIAVLSGEKAI